MNTRTRTRSDSVQKALNDPRLSSSLTDMTKENKKSPARLQFESKVQKYFYQLQTGCQENSCDSKFCVSNPKGPKLSTEQAAVMAVQLASYTKNLTCPRIDQDIEVQFTAFSLSPFSTPSHSRSNSRSNLKEETQPFIHSILSSSAFSSIFGGSKVHKSPSNDSFSSLSVHSSIPNIVELGKGIGDLVRRQRAATTSDLDIASGKSTPQSIDGRIALKKLDYHLLEIAVETYRDGQSDPTFLLNTVDSVFSSTNALSQSFLVFFVNEIKSGGPRLFVPDVVKAYSLILEQSPKDLFESALAAATEALFTKLQILVKQSPNPGESQLRVLLIVLLNPLLYQEKYRMDFGKQLAKVMGKLRSRSKAILAQWLSDFSVNEFSSIVSLFKELITSMGPPAIIPEESFVGAVKVLSLLSHANEQNNTLKIPIEDFYVPELTQKLNFKEEFRKWRKSLENDNISEFALINYPFLFDPVAKTRIMHIDAWVKMSLKYEDAYVNQTLVFQAQKFLDDSESMQNLETELQKSTNPFFLLEIRRNHLVADTLDQLSKNTMEIRKPLKIKFVGGGEEGMDQGGVQKEFFQVLVSEILDPNFGMFNYDSDTRYSWFNPATLESNTQFELVGMVIGLALYNGVMIRVLFPPLFYKKLLKEEITLEDVKMAFPSLGNGLQHLLDWEDGDVSDVFMRTFEISYERFGHVEHIPLKPDGHEMFVTNENRLEYVDLYINHLINTSIEGQFRSFQQGFYKVCGGRVLSLCRPSELELMLCGMHTNELDFLQLEQGATYDDGYSRNHKVIQWFWEIVHAMDMHHKRNLLEFVTASDRVPLKGLESLLFVIQRNGPDTDRLPSALTCFGRLLLPEYSSAEKLKERLITAIENAKGFGLV